MLRNWFVHSAQGSQAPGAGDDFWYQPLRRPGAGTGAGILVTPELAIKSQAVYACVSKIAKIIAMMPCRMQRTLDTGGQELAPDHELDELLHYQPNMVDTAIEFWQAQMWHAILRGVAYAEIKGTNRKHVSALIPIHPLRVTPEKLESGRWRFRVQDDNGTFRYLSQDQVFRFNGLTTGGVLGLGLCEHADEAIALGMAADQYASRVFSNALNIGVILTHPQKISEQAQENLISAFMKRLSGAKNAHRPVLLQEGIKAEKLGQTADEAQLLEARKWQTLEVCRALDMPPIMVGINEGALGANVEEQSLNFVRYTLQPWAKRIEQSVRRDLIMPEADGRIIYKAEFNFSSLLRGNAQARSAYFSAALGSGGSPAWMSVNEVRELDNLNRLDDPLFDRPALGTNPQQTPDTGKKPTPVESDSGGEEDETEARPVARLQGTLSLPKPAATVDTYELKCKALIGKEVKVLHKYASRFAGDINAFKLATGAFYRSHVASVMQGIGVPKYVARVYCLSREKRFAEAKDILGAIDWLEVDGLAELIGTKG